MSDNGTQPPKGTSDGSDTDKSEAKSSTKAASDKSKAHDPFYLSKVFPDALGVFAATPSLEEVKSSALVMLDTNTLVDVYDSGTKSFSQIEKEFRKLRAERRLIVPGHVAREYGQNRVKAIAKIHQKLTQHLEQAASSKSLDYAIFEGVSAESVTKYRDHLQALKNKVESWSWNDRVSSLYREIFDSEVVFDEPKPSAEIQKDCERRRAQQLPPGFKDNGIGDILIWHSILEIGRQRKLSVIFVSSEKKPDWWHCTPTKHELYPRYELVDEFRRESGGASFHILHLSQLLELLGADKQAVEEVEEQEARQDAVPAVSWDPCAQCGFMMPSMPGAARVPCARCGSMNRAYTRNISEFLVGTGTSIASPTGASGPLPPVTCGTCRAWSVATYRCAICGVRHCENCRGVPLVANNTVLECCRDCRPQ